MPDLIWQVGESGDDQICALALQTKNNARRVTTLELVNGTEDPFSLLTIQDRLQIVASFSLLEGTASNFPPEAIASFLITYGLRRVGRISLVICNSALQSPGLGGRTFLHALRECLIAEARGQECSLHVRGMSGRIGYVNVYHEGLQQSDPDGHVLVQRHFQNTGRPLQVGRKYMHSEPTVKSDYNRFYKKGESGAKVGTWDIIVAGKN
jgi:hypothetical protein